MERIVNEISIQEKEAGTYRIVIRDKNGIVQNIIEERNLIDAINIASLMLSGPLFDWDEKTQKKAI